MEENLKCVGKILTISNFYELQKLSKILNERLAGNQPDICIGEVRCGIFKSIETISTIIDAVYTEKLASSYDNLNFVLRSSDRINFFTKILKLQIPITVARHCANAIIFYYPKSLLSPTIDFNYSYVFIHKCLENIPELDLVLDKYGVRNLGD